MTTKSKFISIEGGDGAGKSTFIPVIVNYLKDLGHDVVVTREPGGTELGEQLRDVLLNKKMSVASETLLMFAARAEHLETVINPALNSGKWVICDRFTDSTQAYQCAGKGYPVSKLQQLKSLVQDGLEPGITFVFDVPLHVSKERLAKTGKTPDKFESENDLFKENVNHGYKSIVKQNPERCKLIDSSKSIEDTKEQVLLHLSEFVQVLENEKKRRIKP